MVPLDKGLQWRSLKQKPFSRIKQINSQAYSEPPVTLAYLEPRYIQNQKHIQSRGMFRTLAYSEPCETSTMEGFRENS